MALNVALVGCGNVARSHAEVIARGGDYALAALYDSDPARAQAFSQWVQDEFKLPAPHIFSNFDEVVADAGIDVIALCTPSGIHLEHAEVAVRAGKHLIIEKPIDVSLSRAQAFKELLQQYPDPVVSVIFQHRFDAASLIVKHAIDNGQFGKITSITASVDWWRPQSYYDSADWRGTWALDGGGALVNQAIHTVDLVNWFAGPPRTVSAFIATSAHDRLEVEDVGVAIMDYDNGTLGTFHGSTSVFPDFGVRIQVHGDRGGAVINNSALEYFVCHGVAAAADVPAEFAHLVQDHFIPRGRNQASRHLYGPHNRQYDDVARAITSGSPLHVGIDESIEALTTVKSMYVAAVNRMPVLWQEVYDLAHEALDLHVFKHNS